MSLDTMQDLLAHQLQELYAAERQMLVAWPRLAAATTARSLRLALQLHQEATEGHVVRLERALELLDAAPQDTYCAAVERMLRAASFNAASEPQSPLRDALILGDCQRVEGYEIAAYATARTFAESLGQVEIARLLERTLVEEEVADAILTEIDRREVRPARRTVMQVRAPFMLRQVDLAYRVGSIM